MSDRPAFIYAATYADVASAEDDYFTLLDWHTAELVGTYDVALVAKDADGKVRVQKYEKPALHGFWGGIAVAAAVGVLAAPAIIPAALAGGAIGALGGHFKKGTADHYRAIGTRRGPCCRRTPRRGKGIEDVTA